MEVSKEVRHRMIREIVDEGTVETQEELLDRLRDEGIQVTQATVSRDIKELRLSKVPSARTGRYTYASGEFPSVGDTLERARRAAREYIVSVDWSGQLVVVRTLSGAANAVAAAFDELRWPGVLASVAGDDTILLVVKIDEGTAPPPAGVQEILGRLARLRS